MYYCSSNNRRVTVEWFLNETLPSTDPALGIITHGIKTTNSSLIIPGLLKFNNIKITCYASGIVTGVGYFDRRIDTTLRIQGRLYNK